MTERQYATPVVVRAGKTVPLHRVGFDDAFHDEDWVQRLLFENPNLIPFEEMEPAFKGSVPVAREVESGAGPVDILCVNADGLLTVVETKLWRNPQSRREVVSQLIDYAAALAKKTYDELANAVRGATGAASDPLLDRLRAAGHTVDAPRFHDAVSRNLRRGRFLLMAIGDGIQEGVETMADFLQGQPHLGFALRLVEMALFRTVADENDELFVQPRVVARTREVVRAVIDFRGGERVEVSTPPPEETGSGGRRFTITEEEYFRQLGEETGPAGVEFVKRVIRQAPKHHLTVEWKQSGPLLKYFDNDHDVFFTLGGFDRWGNFAHTSRFWGRCDELELPEGVWADYFDALVRLIPGASRNRARSKAGNEWEEVVYQDDAEPIAALIAKEAEWWAAVDNAVARVRTEMAKR
jgi:hypothetical protein